jgi:hypothetical protein
MSHPPPLDKTMIEYAQDLHPCRVYPRLHMQPPETLRKRITPAAPPVVQQ